MEKPADKALLMTVAPAVLSACLLAGCGHVAPGPPETMGVRRAAPPPVVAYEPKIGTYGGTLNQAVLGDPKSFNPITAMETSTTVVTGLLFLGLMRVDGVTLQPVPELAESYEASDGGLTYTFHLRKGLEWSDGAPLTADDVVFTFQTIFDPSILNSSVDMFTIGGKRKKINGEEYRKTRDEDRAVLKMENGKELVVEKVDSLTVRVRLPEPFAPFLLSMAGGISPIVPRHKLEKAWLAGGFAAAYGVSTKPEEVVCSGPFVLENYREGERILLKRNPRYWRRDREGNRLPYLDGVTMLIAASQDVMTLKFKAGEIDSFGMRGSDFPELKRLQEKRGDFTILDTGPGTSSNFLMFNQNPGINKKTNKPYVDPVKLRWFRNVKFRRAVAHSIDRDGIIDIIMNGFGYPQWGPSTRSRGYFHNPNVPRYSYNPAKARAILASEGFRDRDGDGYLEDDRGNTVEFSLITNAGNKVREKIAPVIRKDLENVGIRVHFSLVEFNTIVNKIDHPPYDWEAIIIGLTGGSEPHFGSNVWKSSGSMHMWHPKQEKPATEWEREIDEIYEKASKILDRRERKRLYDRWQVIATEQLPFIYTVTPAVLVAVRDKFENLFPTPLGGVFHNIDEIFVKER